ncbi:tRNA (guanine(37)-N1)-methyltransferase [Cryptococcus depauperatus CBS 7841]|uniref:tRNA (guanine(37)-N1)-methyltransferase n=1 Tax=Cryptococcus depauperatus CBS 7841 TaxID=1295531 RepID=A0A1E3IVD8_9TREE|nr:tRNA (guanine(37)-N1)-methyltransferase [Cryptococcus depauperatus CBS 7841]
MPPSALIQLSPSSTIRPPRHEGMTQLDRSAFDLELQILSAVTEPRDIGKLRSHHALKSLVLDLSKTRPIVDCPTSLVPPKCKESKGLKLLRLHLSREQDLPAEARAVLQNTKGLVQEVVKLGYENWSPSQILNACLPVNRSDDIPSSFTTTGHIGHMNLREEWLPYRYLIGQVILDKNPALRTIVNKLDTIHAQFRYFDMEVIAGDEDYITTVNESNCTFTFNFSNVYWNSRLHHEHERLIKLFSPGCLVADVMAGVGPFAIPAAKKRCYVAGNDLNPESVKWMKENRIKNKVEHMLRVSEFDGHKFIREAPLVAWTRPFDSAPPPRASNRQRNRGAKETRKKKQQVNLTDSMSDSELQLSSSPVLLNSGMKMEQPPKTISHFIMNLPDSALTFLDSYCGCYLPLLSHPSFLQEFGSEEELAKERVEMPMVHCYCFTKEVERSPAETDILQRASHYLSFDLTPQIQDYNLHHVRSVAPNKDMYCLSFRLPRQVAFRRV